MTNHQAAMLRPGHRVRRKASPGHESDWERTEVLVVERIVPPKHRYDMLTVLAGGYVFKAWGIERVHDID